MFGEATAKHLGLLLNIPPRENQHDLLRQLGKIAFVDDNILSVFHKLRRIGNQAAHEYHNDLDDAQMCLRLGFRLAVWYYRLVTKDYDFPVPVFVLPERGENLYHQEVLTLKQQLEQQVREKAQTQAEVASATAEAGCPERLYRDSGRQNSRKQKRKPRLALRRWKHSSPRRTRNWPNRLNRNVRLTTKKLPIRPSSAHSTLAKKRAAS